MSDGTTVYIAAIDSIGTIVLPPDESGTVVFGSDALSVVVATPDIIAVPAMGPQAPGTIILGPDQIGTVVIGDNPVTVVLSTPQITVTAAIPGPQGPPGDGGAETAVEISYSGEYPNVQAALDALLYVAPEIESFSNNVGTVEIGATVSSLTLAWTLNKTVTSLALDNAIGSVLGLTSKSLTGLSLTDDTTYQLTASDDTNTVSAETTVAFRNKRYWGVSASPSLDSDGVLALGNSEFATSFAKSITYNASSRGFPYYAYPAVWGTPSAVTVGGLAFSDLVVDVVSVTNASGYTQNYNVIRFGNTQTGASIAVVWA